MVSSLFTADAIQSQRERLWQAARALILPRERLSVSAWAEKNLYLSERVTQFPGFVRLNRTPYLREIVDTFGNDSCRRVTNCKGAQIGHTLTLQIAAGFAIDHDPGPSLFVMQSAEDARSFSETRLQPLIDTSPQLARHKPSNADRYKLMEMHFDTMTLNIVGAGSPGKLASRPIRYLFKDELDKWKGATAREASASSLADLRTRTYWNHFIFEGSTPTIATGETWRQFLAGDQRKYFVPCHNCGEYQCLKWDQVKWPDAKNADGDWDLAKVSQTTRYVCESCAKPWTNAELHDAVTRGEWQATNDNNRPFHRSYQTPAMLAPWVSISELAVEWVTSHRYPDKLQNFVNSTLAEPWEQYGEAATEEDVLKCIDQSLPSGSCPAIPLAVVMTVDVQQDSIWFVVRAWDEHETSWLLDYGQLPDFEALKKRLSRRYTTLSGQSIGITYAGIDSGYRADDVYRFCLANNATPMKGQERIKKPYEWSKVKTFGGHPVKLLSFLSDYYMDALQRRIGTGKNAHGGWILHRDTNRNYVSQLTAETPIEGEDKWGRPTRKWKRKGSRANHLGDCEKMQSCLVMTLGIRDLKPNPS